MSRSKLLATTFAAVTLSFSGANAGMSQDMEKCKVVDANGKGLIKAHKADCKSANSSCAGHNKAGDAESWILVPKGECDKINAGDFTGVSDAIKDKVEVVETAPKSEDMKNKGVHMHDKAMDMKDKGMHMHDKAMDMKDKGMHMHDKAMDMKNKGVHMHDKAMDMKDKMPK